MLTVVVGSTNPVKVEAVREVFKKIYGEKVKIEGMAVESGVNEQPRSEGETREGARNRALFALEQADYGVGIEGGVSEIEGKLFECAWCVVASKDNQLGYGGGLYFELPEKIAKKIRAGGELGPIMDELTGESDVKKKGGAIGILTKNNLNRQIAYEQIILSAMVRFLSPEWFLINVEKSHFGSVTNCVVKLYL